MTFIVAGPKYKRELNKNFIDILQTGKPTFELFLNFTLKYLETSTYNE